MDQRPVRRDIHMSHRRKVMLARMVSTGIITTLLVPVTVALAQSDVPDLKGQWLGTVENVRRGEVFEHNDPAPDIAFGTVEFTITIDRQEGRRFAGSWASVRASDPLIGTLRSDGRRLHMVDNDGTFTGELLGPDEMEVCRTEIVPMTGTPESMIASCGTFTRQR
jgi:hypothetical protein